jgi:hypothetical protein
VNNNELHSKLRGQTAPTKVLQLLEHDDRVIAIELLKSQTKSVSTTTFLDLLNSPLKYETPSYLKSVFSNEHVASFISDLLKISQEKAKEIQNLDDFDKYMYEIHKEMDNNNKPTILMEKKIEFLWRYYGATLGYKDHSRRFQQLTTYMLQNRNLKKLVKNQSK